jgi:hypothetical protein
LNLHQAVLAERLGTTPTSIHGCYGGVVFAFHRKEVVDSDFEFHIHECPSIEIFVLGVNHFTARAAIGKFKPVVA